MAMRELLESDFKGFSSGNFTDDDRKKDHQSWEKFHNYYEACLYVDGQSTTSLALAPV